MVGRLRFDCLITTMRSRRTDFQQNLDSILPGRPSNILYLLLPQRKFLIRLNKIITKCPNKNI